ncbi:rod-binding protein [Massilia sp. BJB1822]|uniref:rod-binding protein n=1 Tax=Massilia sp. BJB1822 TaxID=2744470 RepID=UPI001593885E|nr:rod-binding protein [Massilia sp. BJB1822]NVD99470.1 rod-binding protein [Massilia sp. BJB1822]
MNNRISSLQHPALAAEEQERIAAAQPAVDGVDPEYRAKATEAATKFESFFISHLLHQMRNSTREMAGEDSIFKDQINQDMLDMADNLVADSLAGRRAFGVADAILRQLLPAPTPVAPASELGNISTEKKPGAAA